MVTTTSIKKRRLEELRESSYKNSKEDAPSNKRLKPLP